MDSKTAVPGDFVDIETARGYRFTGQVFETRPGDYGTVDILVRYPTAIGIVREWIPSRRWRHGATPNLVEP